MGSGARGVPLRDGDKVDLVFQLRDRSFPAPTCRALVQGGPFSAGWGSGAVYYGVFGVAVEF